MSGWQYSIFILDYLNACANSPVFEVENDIGKLVSLQGCQLLFKNDISVKTLIFYVILLTIEPDWTRTCHHSNGPLHQVYVLGMVMCKVKNK